MKKSILILAFILGFSAITSAQRNFRRGPKSPEQKLAMLTKELQKKLHLKADQTSQVNNIMFTQVTRLDSLKSNLSTTNPMLNQLARKNIMLTTDSKLNNILNPDQMKLYQDLKVARKEKMMAKRNSTVKS